MMLNIKTVATTALAFAALGNSHMLIAKPVPYGKATLNNSPLVDASPGSAESDYPCKQRPGVYDISEMNHIQVGTPQELSFIGSASHGGGTCQLAVTKDKEPTADSTFKVFQVFEGGCPVSSDGNTGSHPFTFVLPKDMPNGVMTFAWFWYNRIGNRELYMNCAPITVTGGSSNDDYFNSLPNAYVVNMPTSECQTSFEGIQNAVTIPHPGQFIMKQLEGQEPHAATGPGCAAAAAKMLEGVKGYKSDVVTNNGAAYNAPAGAPPSPSGGASAAPSGGASAAPSGGASAAPSGGASAAPSGGASAAPSGGASAAPSGSAGASAAPSGSAAAAPSAPAGSVPAGSASAPASAPAASGSAAAAPSGSAPAPSAAPSGAVGSAAPSAPVASGSAAVAPSAAAPSGAVQSGAACSSTSDAITCSSDGKQFGVCSNGKMVFRAVAPGTSCRGGQIEKRSEFTNRHVRRHLRHAGRHAL